MATTAQRRPEPNGGGYMGGIQGVTSGTSQSPYSQYDPRVSGLLSGWDTQWGQATSDDDINERVRQASEQVSNLTPWSAPLQYAPTTLAQTYSSSAAPATSAAQPAPASVGLDTKALTGLDSTLSGLQTQQGQTQQFNTGLRDALMSQLSSLSKPVTATDPSISGALAANRLTAQRTAERGRSAMAERLGAQGLGSSGAMDTGILGVNQARGEQEMLGNNAIFQQEIGQRRAALQNLLNPALQLGDQEAARNIQNQLGIFDRQLSQSNTYDDAGYRLAALQALLNGQSIDAILGGL